MDSSTTRIKKNIIFHYNETTGLYDLWVGDHIDALGVTYQNIPVEKLNTLLQRIFAETKGLESHTLAFGE